MNKTASHTSRNVIVIRLPEDRGTTDVPTGDTLFISFTESGTFTVTGNSDDFVPSLPNGHHFDAHDLWGPAYAVADDDDVPYIFKPDNGGYRQDDPNTGGGVIHVGSTVQEEAK